MIKSLSGFSFLERNLISYMSLNISFSIRNQNDIIKIALPSNDEFDYYQMSIKTRSRNGIIFSMYSTNDQYSLILYIKNGKLQLKYHLSDNRTSHTMFEDNRKINTGEKFDIIISKININNKHPSQIFIPLKSSLLFDILVLGGSNHVLSNDQIIACFSNITYNYHPLLPEGIMKSDRYDCFYDQKSVCDKKIPCQIITFEQFCNQNDCSLVCIPSLINRENQSLIQYSSEIKSHGQYEQIHLTIFTAAGNSTLYRTTNDFTQVSIILQVEREKKRIIFRLVHLVIE